MEQCQHRFRLLLLFAVVVGMFPVVSAAAEKTSSWYQQDQSGSWQVNLYFFWSSGCPHCQEARPVIAQWEEKMPWLEIHSLEVTGSSEHLARYREMARQLGHEARSVPAFFYCGKMVVGFDNEVGMGKRLLSELEQCHLKLVGGDKPGYESAEEDITLPLLGNIREGGQSLLLVTVVIAALDAFNPCAFFVLLFLLSLLIHSRSRQRMLFIGGVFIFFSGFFYFLFMAAWLNLFLLIGMQRLFTMVAGVVAVTLAFINIKDFLIPGQGISLSIAEERKKGLFQRVRALLQAQSMTAVTLGTIALAVAANSYELLCTSGLPMVFTRMLTLETLPGGTYYLYLLLYNLIYVIPLLLILLLFTLTLGQRKLQPEEGRLLKLLSGIMMLELGIGLVWQPERLNSIAVVAGGMMVAVILTVIGGYFLRKLSQH